MIGMEVINENTKAIRKNQRSDNNEQIKNELINVYGVPAFDHWLKFIIFSEEIGNDVYFVVKNRFARDWILKNYKDGIMCAIAKIFPAAKKIIIDLKNDFDQEIIALPDDEYIKKDDATKKIKKVTQKNVKQSDNVEKNFPIKKRKVARKAKMKKNGDDDMGSSTLQAKKIKEMILGEGGNIANAKKKTPQIGKKSQKKTFEKMNNVDKSNNESGVKRKRIVKKNDKNEVVLQISAQNKKDDDDFAINLNPRLTFDTFVVGKPNEFAFNAMRRVAAMEQIDTLTNPLFLRGDVGLGKTHLMYAAAYYMHSYSKERRVIYMTAEKFMYQFIRALRDKNIIAFKKKLRSVDVLMIDDIQFLSGKGGTQDEFFHTFNSLIENKKQLIFAADRPPNELKEIEQRIISRLSGGLIVDIHTTNFELRFEILKAKMKHASVEVPNEVLKFLAENINTNVRELEGALNRVIMHHDYTQKPVNMADTRELLRDMLKCDANVVTVDLIKKKVADFFNIRVDDLMSKSRLRKITQPRQIAMFLAKDLTTKSLLDVGREFARDHTTVMYSIKTIRKNIEKDDELVSNIKKIRHLL